MFVGGGVDVTIVVVHVHVVDIVNAGTVVVGGVKIVLMLMMIEGVGIDTL